MTTIREHLGAAYVLSAHLCERPAIDEDPAWECPGCLCAKEIEAAIDLLNETERCGCVGWLVHLADPKFRFVLDPEASA